MDRSHGHREGQIHEQEPHHTFGHQTVGDQDQNQHEKKSVLKKVKAKAKKIKDTITKHGHGRDHHEHIPDDHDLDDEEEEIIEDPKIHGAPMYESVAVTTGRSTGMDIDPLPPNLKPESHVQGPEGARGQQRLTLGSTTVMGDVPHTPLNTPMSHNAPGIPQTGDSVPTRTGMGDVPQDLSLSHNPPGIDLSRDNVTGRTVVGDLPHAPQDMPVHLDPPGIHYSKENVPSSTGLGSDDVQGRPGIHLNRDNGHSRTFVYGQEDSPGQPEVNLERPTGLEEDPAVPKDTPGAYTASNYQTKVTNPTGKGGEEAGITSVLHSFDKMNVYGEPEGRGKARQEHDLVGKDEDLDTSVPTGSHGQFSPELTPPKRVAAQETFDGTKPQEHLQDEAADRPSNQGRSYTSAIVDKAISAKNVDQFSPELTPPKRVAAQETFDGTKPQEHLLDEAADRPSNQGSSYTSAIVDKAISAKNVVVAKLGYGEKDDTGGRETLEGVERPTNQGGYTEKISSATSAIADKVISAKIVVASKLGYGEKDNTGGHEMHLQGEGERNSASASAVDYGKKVASTVTEKLAPVYRKVAGAGSTVVSKIPGTGTHTDNQQHIGVEGQDKGVSVMHYFAEKLRPGEEDRALSEVISEALHKQKPGRVTRPVKEVVSDAVHKRDEEPDEVTTRPTGKVTESEEAARRLGTFKDDPDQGVGNKGMVDKIKGAVGSWLVKGDQSPGSQTGSASDDVDRNVSGERRLQEN